MQLGRVITALPAICKDLQRSEVTLMYSYDDIFLFIKVVDVGSFSDSAKLLKVNAATIGRRIRALEDSLGVTLIRRDSRNFELTAAGEQVYQEFSSKDKLFDEVIKSIIAQDREANGVLRVALPLILGLEKITPYIYKFNQQYPNIRLEVCYQHRIISMIKDGFDVAIINHLPMQQMQKVRKVFSTYMNLYCTQKYADKYGIPDSLDTIFDYPIAGAISYDYTVPDSLMARNNKTGEEVSVKIPVKKLKLCINNALGGVMLLKTHEYIVGLPHFLDINSINEPLVKVLPDYNFGEADYYLLRHPHEKRNITEILVKYLLSALDVAF